MVVERNFYGKSLDSDIKPIPRRRICVEEWDIYDVEKVVAILEISGVGPTGMGIKVSEELIRKPKHFAAAEKTSRN